jgi:hypothetical protein
VPDFFLWGFLKERANRNRPNAPEELKRAVQAEIAVINQDQDLLHRVFDTFVDHLRQCTATEGAMLLMLCTINNNIASFNINMARFISSLPYCVISYRISKYVSRLCATLYMYMYVYIYIYISLALKSINSLTVINYLIS